MDKPKSGLCETCKNRQLITFLDNDTENPIESATEYFRCSKFDSLGKFSMEPYVKGSQYENNFELSSITSQIVNCTGYDISPVVTMGAVTYDRATGILTVGYTLSGGDGTGTLYLYIDSVVGYVDMITPAVNGAGTFTTAIVLTTGQFNIRIQLVEAGTPVTPTIIDAIADTNTVDLTVTGTTLTADVRHQDTADILLGEDASGLKADLTTTGIVAGSYTSVDITVDSKGRITAIANGASGSGTVTSVAALTIGTAGTDVSSTVATPTTTPVITLNIPTASATNRGALSSADWTTFNNKQAALGYTPEDVANKTNTVVGNEASTTLYLSVKGYYDYLIGFTWLTDSIFGTWINALTSKTTPVDADQLLLMDSADSNKSKKLSWANAKIGFTNYSKIRVLDIGHSSYSLTGTTNETILLAILVPANTIGADKSLQLHWRVIRSSGTAGTIAIRVRVYTTASPSPVNTGTMLATGATMGTSVNWEQLRRTLVYKSATSTTMFSTGAGVPSDDVQANQAQSSVNIDWTVDQYLLFTLQNSNSGDTSSLEHVDIFIIG